ncbi:MAG TPA: hypothetical protein VJ739_17555 [Gemmataceae bacterium]|nr:hypothetical protein [Gemmataceae bacterium]
MSPLLQQLGQQLGAVFHTLGRLLYEVGAAFPLWPLLLVWVVVWLLAVNWQRLGPLLRRGGWAPAVLLLVLAALVWSQIAPDAVPWAIVPPLPSFWWQVAVMVELALLALFCGWLQGVFGWAPPEINLEPPAAPAHGPDHGHH